MQHPFDLLYALSGAVWFSLGGRVFQAKMVPRLARNMSPEERERLFLGYRRFGIRMNISALVAALGIGFALALR